MQIWCICLHYFLRCLHVCSPDPVEGIPQAYYCWTPVVYELLYLFFLRIRWDLKLLTSGMSTLEMKP